MNFYKVIMILIIIIGALLQHIIHEFSHVLIAKFNGIRTIKIEWFTYSKLLLGTRVTFENEPELNEKSIEKRWGWVSIAGFVSTTLIGYILIIIYYLSCKHISNWLILIICFFSMIFLTFDPLYFVLGSMFDFGDVMGLRKAFSIKKSVSILFFIIILSFNILLIKLIWYSL